MGAANCALNSLQNAVRALNSPAWPCEYRMARPGVVLEAPRGRGWVDSVLGTSYDVAKVLDFGIVKDLGDKQTQTMTAAGSFPGTPGFLAPEILLEQGDASPASDLYALGCAAYYLLTSAPVFEGENVLGAAMLHMTRAPAALSKRLPEIPAALDEIVMAMLDKAPEESPRDAGVVRRALSSVASHWSHDQSQQWWKDNLPELATLHRITTPTPGEQDTVGATAMAADDP